MASVENCSDRKSLGIWDITSLLIGIVVGVSIFKAPPLVFQNVETAWTGLAAWGVGAFLSLCGALCFCELATSYPGFGGEYQYLSRAYGKRIGFLFGWMQVCVILTGSIGAMAFVFADYSIAFYEDIVLLLSDVPASGSSGNATAFAAGLAILFSAVIHACGVRSGKFLQNLLSLSKVIALVAILLVGLCISGEPTQTVAVGKATDYSWGLALVFVMYAYGGWNDIAMVTPEVRNHQRNMPRALLLGLSFIALLYFGLNLVFLKILGFEGIRQSRIPAADVMRIALGSYASLTMNFIVMCSALGAIHGTTFASCRLVSAIGNDFKLFRKCGVWSKRGVPLLSLILITGVSLLLILAVGTSQGQTLTALTAQKMYLPAPDWEKYYGGFDTLIAGTAPVFWIFFTLSGLAVVVLRIRDKQTERPFRVPLFPLPVIIFCSSAGYMLWKSLEYAKELTLLSLPILCLGVLISFTSQISKRDEKELSK